jgi:hypothetical protein
MNAPHDLPSVVAAFNPAVVPRDPVAALWGAEVTLRLRRELAWCWQLAGATGTTRPGALPPPADPLADSIDRLRHHDTRRAFMADDVTARYLGEQIVAVTSQRRALAPTPVWHRLANDAGLDETALFVLALALAARTDAAFGPVAAACQADSSRSFATLALAQRLWSDPLALVACADTSHALYRHALLPAPSDPGAWHQPLELPAALAMLLLDPLAALPPALQPVPDSAHDPRDATEVDRPTAAWLRAQPPRSLQVVPLRVPNGADAAAATAQCAARAGNALAALPPDMPPEHHALPGLAAAAWLRGVDLLAPDTWAGSTGLATALQPLAALPLRLWLPQDEGPTHSHGLPSRWLAPALCVPALTTPQRRARLAAALPETLAPLALEAARRYRLNDRALGQVTATLSNLPRATGTDLHALCSAAATLDVGTLAQPVTPRFALSDLVLPPRQRLQLQAIVAAMGALARVHHEWGTARAWNESGISVLFCGPPGTGKTMAAEALATEMALPMFRIDLSQVVNKYIGETEKNLRRIFDAAEATETLLLFDEADALFGKRTEVKDAHDRYANLEVSYLLERMERFKGLAVLATNRRRDLDEAFTRRLRYIVEFPLPKPTEREALWRGMFAPEVDVSAIDFEFVARRFEMAGGPIRSAAFNACLHAAQAQAEPAVDMPALLLAIQRELEKAGRETQREQFGAYAHLLPEHT